MNYFSDPVFYSWTIPELVWTFVSSAGLIYAWKNLVEARGDVEAVEQIGNGARAIAANGYHYRSVLRIVTQGIFVSDGVVAGLTEPSDWARAYIVSTLVISAVLVVLANRSDVHQRQKLEAHFRREVLARKTTPTRTRKTDPD